MSMHLHHPSLSLSGKRKGKVKFRNAEEAKKARELDASWKELQKKWEVDADEKRRTRALKAPALEYKLTTPVGRSSGHAIPSRADSVLGPVSSKVIPQYTGTKMIGVGTMHKSNAVPIFSDEEAHDIATMRRG
jgi:hypothetical protein